MMLRFDVRRLVAIVAALSVSAAAGAQTAAAADVVTYHYDALRTGWNQHETSLTAANVQAPGFGVRKTVALDDQVDAQPLVVAHQAIAGTSGFHQVVYVATENDTVYAIDANSGAVLKQRSLGTPVSQANLPGACGNNGPNIGINSTPVIDLAGGSLYVVAYTWEKGAPVYRIHALDLATLADKVPAVVVKALHAIPNGGMYRFNTATARQRPGLLQANGNVYAGFGSFCDFNENDTRGWVLGWKNDTLAPLANNELTNRLYNQTKDCPWNNNHPPCLLASIWMSGYGVAADASGSLFFVTGNSAPGTYDGVFAIQDSVVKVAPDLHAVTDLFTPSDKPGPGDYGVNAMDGADNDFGSGGVMLLPDQPGSTPHLAVASGKIGPLYLLNRDHLGGHGANGHNDVLGTVANGGCWCGPSYFVGSDGVSRVVSSTGANVSTWKVNTAPSPALVLDKSTAVPNGQDPGFMTSVSSNGTTAGTAIIWAVPHPTTATTKPPNVVLYAIDGTTGTTLFSQGAGAWPFTGGNANIVPVVADGKVFVASYKTLSIFGLGATAPMKFALPIGLATTRPLPYHEISGTVESVSGNTITLRTRTGRLVNVDRTLAAQAHHSVITPIGSPVVARGSYGANGTLRAQAIARAKHSPGSWEPDR